MVCRQCLVRMKCTYSVPLFSKRRNFPHLRYRVYTCPTTTCNPRQISSLELPSYIGGRMRGLEKFYLWGRGLWQGNGRYQATAKKVVSS